MTIEGGGVALSGARLRAVCVLDLVGVVSRSLFVSAPPLPTNAKFTQRRVKEKKKKKEVCSRPGSRGHVFLGREDSCGG